MAIRTKTVIFATPSFGTDLVDNVATNLDQITIHIPEANPVFRSVFVETAFRDKTTAAGTIGTHATSLRLGAAAYTTITETDDITNTGENLGGVLGPWDFTAHFTANWSGTSMTCDVQVLFDQTGGTTLGMRNVSAIVYVTYDYDDAAATQIKTVRLPMESTTGPLPTASTALGSNQIPQLTGAGGILPEANVVIRDWFVVIEGNNSANASATDWSLIAAVDGDTLRTTFSSNEMALASDVFDRWVYNPLVDFGSIPDPTVAHQFELWASVARANHITATLYVTYEFTLAGTSRVLNSTLIPIEISSPLGATTTAEASRFSREFLIAEPGTITLRQSGFRINYNIGAGANHTWRAGGQAYRTYTGAANVVAGMFSMQQRIDAGSTLGAGVALSRGLNTVTIDGYGSSTANQFTNLNGYLLINYESDVPAQGIATAAHTVLVSLLGWDAFLSDRNRILNWEPPFTHDNYWMIASGFCFVTWVQATGLAVTFDVECGAGEGKGGGYYDIYADAYQSDNERACSVIWMRGRDTFRRLPNDIDPDRLDPFQMRDYRLFTTTNSSNGMLAAYTYHQMTWTVAGNLTGLQAGEGLELILVREVDDTPLQRQTFASGSLPSSFSFTVYDNVLEYYVVAQQVTRASRSLSGVAV